MIEHTHESHEQSTMLDYCQHMIQAHDIRVIGNVMSVWKCDREVLDNTHDHLHRVAGLRALVNELRIEHFYTDEDNWYSCPLAVYPGETESGSGCSKSEEVAKGICRCNYVKHNARIDRVLEMIGELT